MASKKRKKWILSIICFITGLILIVIATLFNYKEVPIQDNYIKMLEVIFTFIQWVLGFVCVGYGFKLLKGG